MRVNIEDIKERKENPRNISWHKLAKMKESLKGFPEMLKIRPIVVNKDYEILGGNMRFRAAKELGWSEVDVLVLDSEQEYEFLIKDNLSYGDWQWVNLVDDYGSNELLDWGMDVPIWFREEDVEEEKEKSKDKTKDNDKEKVDIKKSTKKALYLFFTDEDKKLIVEKIKESGLSGEEFIISEFRKLT